MRNQLSSIREQFQSELAAVKNTKDLEVIKVKFFGKKGKIAELMQSLRDLSAEERPSFGQLINDLKQELSTLCDQALKTFSDMERQEQLTREKEDISLPGRKLRSGRRHPIQLMLSEIIEIFCQMGFSVQYGPDIDSDYYNYEGLNFPEDHPARDMQDTFYITPHTLLRSHTSNTQLRVMETHKPPIRIIAPGTVYRNETISARSHVFFHQVEGLYIDENVSFADLLATMTLFCQKLFRKEVKTRYRPSYFPFVEPGLEVDVACTACEGKGCRLCKQTGWLEILGAGMVHPNVLKNGGIDPEKYSGYAWGLGVERLTMLRYGIKDIRAFTENDQRFLDQFA